VKNALKTQIETKTNQQPLVVVRKKDHYYSKTYFIGNSDKKTKEGKKSRESQEPIY